MLPRERKGELGVRLSGHPLNAREPDYLGYWFVVAAVGIGVVLAFLFSVF